MKSIILAIVLLSTSVFGQHKFGWIGDDGHKLAPSLSPNQWPIKTPAASADVSTGLGPVLDQGQIGSCVAHGTTEAYDYAYNKAYGQHTQKSRLQVYYDARKKIGTVNSDSGCQIVDAVNNLMRIGGGKESLWPYDTSKFRIKPPTAVYTDAKKNIAIKAFKVDNTDKVSIPLALTNGYPVIVGSLVYKGIMNLDKNNYILPMPKSGERPLGGHCYLLNGFDKNYYRARNSWSKDYANKGDFLVPRAYIESGRITEDCWVIVEVTK